jgi:DNA polymerase-3 subunit delta
MTALKAHEVARFVARPDLSEGVFLAYGPDGGLVRETIQRLGRHLADGGEVTVLDGDEIDKEPGKLAVEARTTSLFGDKRVIRVRNAGKGAAAVLTEIADELSGVALLLEAGNLTPRDPLRVLVEGMKHGRGLPCYPDSEETLLGVIRDSFAKAGIAADPEVATTLRDLLGNDREVTRREIEKLELYAAASKRLTVEDVAMLCADNAMLAIDEIVDAVGTGHAAELETALARALAATVNPQQILAVLTQHFAQLRRWRAEVDSGKSARAVIDGARGRVHFSRKASMEQQLRSWSDDALAAASERLYLALAESRKTYALQETILRRALLAVCLQASTH